MPTVFTEKTKTTTCAYNLWCENLVDNWRELLNSCPYQFVLSPIHRATDKKPHYHIMFYSGRSNVDLCFETVENFVESINARHANGIVVYGELSARKEMARYFVHETERAMSEGKERFDLRTPNNCQFTIDEQGYCSDTKLTSIFSPEFGYADKGMNFLKLIEKTYREKREERKNECSEILSKLLDYIYDHCVCNFADVVKWARRNGCLDAIICYPSIIRGVVMDMRTSSHRDFHNSDINYMAKEADEIIEEKPDNSSADLGAYAERKQHAFARRALAYVLQHFPLGVSYTTDDFIVYCAQNTEYLATCDLDNYGVQEQVLYGFRDFLSDGGCNI